MKIGEYLIQKGIINEKQLQEALRAQLIYGGHLGTCLMELGYIEENALGHVLAQIYKVPYANPHLFVDILQTVIQALPARVVEKLHAVPFDLREKVLHVASFREELGAMGYKYQFVTLAGFHSLNYASFNMARDFREHGMAAYSRLQEAEFAAEAEGYTATRHQREVGTGYFDAVSSTISGGQSSTTAMADSTESDQFHG